MKDKKQSFIIFIQMNKTGLPSFMAPMHPSSLTQTHPHSSTRSTRHVCLVMKTDKMESHPSAPSGLVSTSAPHFFFDTTRWRKWTTSHIENHIHTHSYSHSRAGLQMQNLWWSRADGLTMSGTWQVACMLILVFFVFFTSHIFLIFLLLLNRFFSLINIFQPWICTLHSLSSSCHLSSLCHLIDFLFTFFFHLITVTVVTVALAEKLLDFWCKQLNHLTHLQEDKSIYKTN